MGTSRISVIQVVDSLHRGGKERIAVVLANALAEAGHESHVIASRSLGGLEKDLHPSVKLYCAKRRSRFDLGGIRRIARYIDDHRIDIVHSHNPHSSYLIRVVLRFARSRPVHVVHDHHGPGLHDRKQAFLDWVMLRHVDAYAAVSMELRDRARRLLRLGDDRCLFLLNGVVIPPEAPPYSGCPTVVQVANIHDPKDHATAVRAAGHLRQDVPDLKWRCVGRISEPPTPYIMEVRELIDQLGLPGCVELFGECVDVLPLLRAAHVGVLTSISEGLPVSVLEYMAAGLPVVLTDVGQAPAIVRQADAGTIVPPRDPEKLAEAVRLILTDPQRARQMGRNGRQFVACHYTVERMAHEVSSLYRMLLAERKR